MTKDWAAVVVSVLAFVVSVASFAVSGATFYFTVYLQTEKISVFFESLPTLRLLPAVAPSLGIAAVPARVEFFETPTVVFINSGTRAVLVTGAALYFREWPNLESMEATEKWCSTKNLQNKKDAKKVGLSFDPFVLEERKTIRKTLTLNPRERVSPVPPWFSKLDYVDDNGYWINVCVNFQLATPSDTLAGDAIVLPTVYRFGKDGKLQVRRDVDPAVPYLIREKKMSIFD